MSATEGAGESPGGLRTAIEALRRWDAYYVEDGGRMLPRRDSGEYLRRDEVLALPELAALGRSPGVPEPSAGRLKLADDIASIAQMNLVLGKEMALIADALRSPDAATLDDRAAPAPATAPAIDLREMCRDEYRGPGQTARAATMLQKTISDWIPLTPDERAWVYACLSDEPPAAAPVQPMPEDYELLTRLREQADFMNRDARSYDPDYDGKPASVRLIEEAADALELAWRLLDERNDEDERFLAEQHAAPVQPEGEDEVERVAEEFWNIGEEEFEAECSMHDRPHLPRPWSAAAPFAKAEYRGKARRIIKVFASPPAVPASAPGEEV